MIGVNLTELSAAFIVTIFECTPRAKIWDPNLPGQCINVPQLFTANGVICVISDLMILLMPIYWVFQLQMPTKRKFGVAAIFATGIFACISSLLQMVSSIQNGRNSRKTFGPTGSVLWSFGEISAGIVCSTLPIFPRIVRHIREKATKKSTVSLPRNLYTYPAEVAKMRKPLESWQGTYDSHMMTRKYHGLVELDEISRLNTVQSYSEAGLSRAITLEDEISYRESSQAENSQIVVIPK
ncbi:hypothetical protein MMC14_007034 [Varicellaria rhodocarpa]|nr:hypothetical protein [Varicellaria rhodocarpa]